MSGRAALELILASTSPYRRVLLERLGLPFAVRAPALDEAMLKANLGPGIAPRALALSLAEAKAASVGVEVPAAIIGGDQLVAVDGQVLGKPGDAQAAIEQLVRLSGRAHELITALAVWSPHGMQTHVDVAVLRMRRLTRPEIERYVAADQPLDCAGAYRLESRGIALFERIACADHSAITGLPLMALTTILRGLGFAVP